MNNVGGQTTRSFLCVIQRKKKIFSGYGRRSSCLEPGSPVFILPIISIGEPIRAVKLLFVPFSSVTCVRSMCRMYWTRMI